MSVLLALLRGERAPGEGDARWPETLALAERHGVAPLLHETARDLPGGPRAALRQARVRALRDQGRLQGALRRALGLLGGAVVLKGAAYSRQLYPEPELRPSGDVDLLVAPERADAALQALAAYRWHQLARPHEERAGWHERSLEDPQEPLVLIDLHCGFSQRERTRLEVAALISRSLPAPELGPGARVLEPTDALLAHAANLGTHELRVPLIAVADLARLWPRAVPALLLERAEEARLCGALYASIELLVRCAPEGLFGGARVELPSLRNFLERSRARVPSALSRQGLAWAASRYDLSRRPLGRAEQLARKALFIDRPLDRVRFALAHARTVASAALRG